MDTLLSVRQLQELFNFDRTTIYRMIKDGRINGIKVGHQWRFSSNEVNNILNGARNIRNRDVSVSRDILPLHCMQPVQDVFAEIAEVGSVTADNEGVPLTKISNNCDFCKLILGSDEGRQACIASWRKLANQNNLIPEFTSCHAGLQYARACIEVDGELIAILVAGQFYLDDPDPLEQETRLSALAQKYNIDKNLLAQAAERISILDSRKTSKIRVWLEQVAHTFKQIGTERSDLMHRLGQIAEMSSLNT
jgi:excisionase family DNA binding protein